MVGRGRGRHAREADEEFAPIFISYTSVSPSLPFRLPYPSRVGIFGTIPDENGVGSGGKESKRGKRRRRT